MMETEKSLWDSLYVEEFPESFKLDWFGRRAYREYLRWITQEDKKILDAGFGTGRFCFALAGNLLDSQIYGIDISSSLVTKATTVAKKINSENVSFMSSDLINLPFPDETFDVVFNEGVIEHLPDYEAAFAEMVRITKNGGKVIVGVPNWYCLPHTIRKKIKEMIGSEYEYGLEKSFRHSELKSMYLRYGLHDMVFGGYYSMQSIIRLQHFSRLGKILSLIKVGKIARFIEENIIPRIDILTGNRFSILFGFEIVIKGIK